ncbi:putative formate dehydrogenase-associated protein [Campylobacter iguaniorum]|uniref:Putative formate dehydrogenase-associated protein n=1 Tax=Campylobacter iguaniorum TaxID=1244531 RepID=A0A076FAR9_9BACT|nr:putative formate dehydrogenase-associated protein [Campylobacter iguaniorum]
MENRREFLKKALQVGAIAGAGVVATNALASSKTYSEQDANGVVSGKSKKKEVLYYKSEAWNKYYKIAY